MKNTNSQPLVIFHSPCADGFTSAWITRKIFPEAEFYPTQHHMDPPNVDGRVVYIFDYAYPREVLLKMKKKALALLVLDHHKGNQVDLEDLVFCRFKMDKSGAGMVWDHFFRGDISDPPKPWLVDYVQDRDLWTWQLHRSKEVSAALDSYPYTFEAWDSIAQRDVNEVADEGRAILRYQDHRVSVLMQSAREVELDGYKILAANSSIMISELGSKLAEGRPFSAVWRQNEKGNYLYSLRSSPNSVDVSVIAKLHGGGGHYHAAGFESDILLF